MSSAADITIVIDVQDANKINDVIKQVEGLKTAITELNSLSAGSNDLFKNFAQVSADIKTTADGLKGIATAMGKVNEVSGKNLFSKENEDNVKRTADQLTNVVGTLDKVEDAASTGNAIDTGMKQAKASTVDETKALQDQATVVSKTEQEKLDAIRKRQQAKEEKAYQKEMGGYASFMDKEYGKEYAKQQQDAKDAADKAAQVEQQLTTVVKEATKERTAARKLEGINVEELYGRPKAMFKFQASPENARAATAERAGFTETIGKLMGETNKDYSVITAMLQKSMPFEDIRKAEKAMIKYGESIGLTKNQLSTLVDKSLLYRDTLTNMIGKREGNIDKISSSYKDLDSEAVLQKYESLKKLSGQIPEKLFDKKITVDVDFTKVGHVSDALMTLKDEASRTAIVMDGLENGARMTGPAMRQLSEASGLSATEITKFGIATERAKNQQEQMSAYMRASRASIGPVGTAFRELGMQVYWAALGFLFLTMTMTRSDQSAYTVANNTNNLAKSYYNLTKLEKEATVAMLEYGQGSEQAADASARLSMAKKDEELNNKQLALSIKNQILMGYQQQLSMIPLLINSGQFMTTLYGSLKGMSAAYTVSLVQERTAKMSNVVTDTISAAGKIKEVQTTLMGTVATKANSGAKVENATVTMLRLVPATQATIFGLKMSTFWATALTSALTFGIGALVSWAASTVMMNMANEEADRQMKQIEHDARAMANSFGAADVAGQGLDYTLAGGSLDKSAKKAAIEMAGLNEEVSKFDSHKDLELITDVEIPKVEMEPIKVEVEKPDIKLEPLQLQINKPDIKLDPVKLQVEEPKVDLKPLKLNIEEPKLDEKTLQLPEYKPNIENTLDVKPLIDTKIVDKTDKTIKPRENIDASTREMRALVVQAISTNIILRELYKQSIDMSTSLNAIIMAMGPVAMMAKYVLMNESAQKSYARLEENLGAIQESIGTNVANFDKTSNTGNTSNVKIDISFGDVTVANKEDMDILVNKIYDSLYKEYTSSGVKM